MTYWHWLAGLTLLFFLAERLRPARRHQPLLRRQFFNDLFYVAFNGHFFAVWFGSYTAAVGTWTRELLAPYLPWATSDSALATLPWALQFALYLVASDFVQWCVHNLLHRVPFLWQFHKVHHSVKEMDWVANWRFHWVEVLVYGALTYVPLALLGGSASALFAVAVFATFWGNLNHANLDVGLGPLGYVFNSPRMHLWHHDRSDEGGVAKHFGIVLSCWDWIFRTAHWPRERGPDLLGYPDDADMPRSLWRQLVFPLGRNSRGS